MFIINSFKGVLDIVTTYERGLQRKVLCKILTEFDIVREKSSLLTLISEPHFSTNISTKQVFSHFNIHIRKSSDH